LEGVHSAIACRAAQQKQAIFLRCALKRHLFFPALLPFTHEK